MDEIYTAEEVAAKLKIKIATVWLWIRTGKLGCVRIGCGRNYRIRQSDIDRYLSSKAQEER